MNVVVRAKVNASTDYASLTASLLLQRDKKQKAIREVATARDHTLNSRRRAPSLSHSQQPTSSLHAPAFEFLLAWAAGSEGGEGAHAGA